MIEATLLTPPAVGAIAVILVRGTGARETIGKIARGGGRDARVAVRRVKFARGTEVIDDGLVVESGENQFELHVHGGMAVIEAMFVALEEAGARRVSVEDVAARNLEEEVERALPKATTETAVRLIANQVETWPAWIEETVKAARGGVWKAAARIQWMMERSRVLRRLLQPARVAIVGPPNAGKSTLANAILGRKAAITSAVAGTTRDWVDAPAVLASGAVSVAVTLVDTAGIRETSDEIEQEAIRRTREQTRRADVAVVVFDGTRGMEEGILQELPAELPRVVVMNKQDLGAREVAGALGISAMRGDGIVLLMAQVLGQLDLPEVDVTEAFVWTKRQWEVLKRAEWAGSMEQMNILLTNMLDGAPAS